MSRRRTPLARFAALCTAFITVWCLGCSAYDAVFSEFGVGMRCAADGDMGAQRLGGMQTASAAHGTDSDAPAYSAAATEAGSDVMCACQSCTAETPGVDVSMTVAVVVPAPPLFLPYSHASAAPEPLVPPPQIAL